MSHPHKTDDAAGDTPQVCHYAALGIVGVKPDPQAAEVNAQRRKQLDALIGKRVTLNHTANYKIAGTVRGISHGVNATVAVRFDTDTHDTHLPPTDLRVI